MLVALIALVVLVLVVPVVLPVLVALVVPVALAVLVLLVVSRIWRAGGGFLAGAAGPAALFLARFATAAIRGD